MRGCFSGAEDFSSFFCYSSSLEVLNVVHGLENWQLTAWERKESSSGSSIKHAKHFLCFGWVTHTRTHAYTSVSSLSGVLGFKVESISCGRTAAVIVMRAVLRPSYRGGFIRGSRSPRQTTRQRSLERAREKVREGERATSGKSS